MDAALLRGVAASLSVDVRKGAIRDMNRLVNAIEKATGLPFIRMEFGIPGLPPSPIAREAEARAHAGSAIAHRYAPLDGVPELKEEASRFVKLFMDLEIPASCIVPTVGAMEGCFAGMALAARLMPERRKVLLLTPGFPANRVQARFLGLEVESIDFYDHRGEKLLDAVEERAHRGDVCAILWSSPNNPSWIVLNEAELRGLGRICDETGILALEDLAYFGMDLRQDYLKPGEAPYQATVMRYTKRGLCIVSSSKMFSYAGQRIALAILSPALETTSVTDFHRAAARDSKHSRDAGSNALDASVAQRPAAAHGVVEYFVNEVLHAVCGFVPQSPQYGLLALLNAANAGDHSLWGPAREYARRAKIMKQIFFDAGFRLVYDNDLGEPLADGFYFTVSHPAFEDGGSLVEELLRYGVSAITLEETGSCRKEGIRCCVSQVGDGEMARLQERLGEFRRDHTD